LEFCQRYAAKHEDIVLIEHIENCGSAVARNTGLEASLGEYYVFVDPDDLLPESAFEILYNSIQESGANVVKGSNTAFSSSSEPKKVGYSVDRLETYRNDDCLTVLLRHEKLRGHPWGKIFRSTCFTEIRFTAGYQMAQDLLYCAEVFSVATHVQLIPDVVYQYRLHSGGATGRKYETGAYLSWLKCIERIEKHVMTKPQQIAYQDLKIRTLGQISREASKLRGSRLIEVFEKISEIRKQWLPPFLILVFKGHISFRSTVRYVQFSKRMYKMKKVIACEEG
jgi:glycosyltransferase involved in cell wall biosynthesis